MARVSLVHMARVEVDFVTRPLAARNRAVYRGRISPFLEILHLPAEPSPAAAKSCKLPRNFFLLQARGAGDQGWSQALDERQ